MTINTVLIIAFGPVFLVCVAQIVWIAFCAPRSYGGMFAGCPLAPPPPDARKIQGHEYTAAFLDEAAEIKPEKGFHQ